MFLLNNNEIAGIDDIMKELYDGLNSEINERNVKQHMSKLREIKAQIQF